jgi:hypothetical protein
LSDSKFTNIKQGMQDGRYKMVWPVVIGFAPLLASDFAASRFANVRPPIPNPPIPNPPIFNIARRSI